jgi:hypothetical protein
MIPLGSEVILLPIDHARAVVRAFKGEQTDVQAFERLNALGVYAVVCELDDAVKRVDRAKEAACSAG